METFCQRNIVSVKEYTAILLSDGANGFDSWNSFFKFKFALFAFFLYASYYLEKLHKFLKVEDKIMTN